MSFILDALRKSENERKRNELPGLADGRVKPPGKNRNFWIPLVALLAGLNLSLLIIMWFMGDANTSLPPPLPAAAAPPAPATLSSPPPARTPAAPPVAPRGTESSRNLLDELEPEPAPAAPAPKAAPVTPPAPAVVETTPKAPVNYLPSLAELQLEGAITVDPLHLDIHVYSDNPSERFVFINMSKYHEGERITEGPVVSEINSVGVVMSHQGRSFLLLRD